MYFYILEKSLMCERTLRAEWAVLPPDSSVEAIPDDVTAKAM